MECIYCSKQYSSSSSLLYHQRTTKSCLKLQEAYKLQENVLKKELTCSFCNKKLSTKYNLTKHQSICKSKVKEVKEVIEEKVKETKFINREEKLEFELKEKEEKIKELQARLEQQEKHPKVLNKTKNITNHITNNILTIYEVMKPEHVEDFFKKHYNLDTLLQGIPGLAKFICDSFIREKASYNCTDRSRHKFTMKDEDGNSVEDTNCEQLVSLTAPGMNHVKDVYENGLFETDAPEIHSSYQPISSLDKDTTPLRTELSKIVPSESIKKPKNNDWKKQFEMMRESYERNKPQEIPQEIKEVEPEVLTIAGYTLGFLMKYKDGYKKRKEIAGCEVEIKGPTSLMELYQMDPIIQEKYNRFITQ